MNQSRGLLSMNRVLSHLGLDPLDRSRAAFQGQRLGFADRDFQAGRAAHVDGIERADVPGFRARRPPAAAVVAIVAGAQQPRAGDHQQQPGSSIHVHTAPLERIIGSLQVFLPHGPSL
jgi:hypothetical protein